MALKFIIISALFFASIANASTMTVSLGKEGSTLISKSYIPEVSEFEAGRQGAAESMRKVMDIPGIEYFRIQDQEIQYIDQFKYGGYYFLTVDYYNVPVVADFAYTQNVPEPNLIFLSLFYLFLLKVKRQNSILNKVS